jgi:hypothetical protein
MKYFDKEERLLDSQVAGRLHEVAQQAAQKELEKILCNEDPSYYSIEITLKFMPLSSDEFKPLRTITVIKTYNL